MSRHDNFRGIAGSFRWRQLLAAPLALLILCSSAPHLLADEIYFTSGYSQKGVVIRETESYVRFKTELGLVTLSPEKIDFIEKASDEENQAMLKRWREEAARQQEQLDAKREAERKFELQQLEKGLVNFEDNWVTPERRQEILNLRREARAHRIEFQKKQLEKGLSKFEHIWVTPDVEKKLLKLEEEIEALVEQIENDEFLVESLRLTMLNAADLREAEKIAKKIEESGARIAENQKKLSRLLNKADDIEAVSVKYKIPKKYINVLPPEEVFE
jgi:hypothetical protein